MKHAQSLREHAGNGIPRFETGRYKFQATLDVPGSLENIAFFFFFTGKRVNLVNEALNCHKNIAPKMGTMEVRWQVRQKTYQATLRL